MIQLSQLILKKHLFHCLTSILRAIPCDSVDRQVGSDVPRTDHSHCNPVAVDLCP